MLFNFPDFDKITERHDIYFRPDIWEKIVKISRKHKLEESKTLDIILLSALDEYEKIYGTSTINGLLPQTEVEQHPKRRYKKNIKKQQSSNRFDDNDGGSERVQNLIQNSKQWSKKYPSCIICGTTLRRHMGKGKCTRCYFIKPEDIVDGKQLVLPRKPMTVEGSSFCQNTDCPQGRTPHFDKDMITVDDLKFCSQKCADEILNGGE